VSGWEYIGDDDADAEDEDEDELNRLDEARDLLARAQEHAVFDEPDVGHPDYDVGWNSEIGWHVALRAEPPEGGLPEVVAGPFESEAAANEWIRERLSGGAGGAV
jgi:hypothetical protein